jgi:hypothetical protein
MPADHTPDDVPAARGEQDASSGERNGWSRRHLLAGAGLAVAGGVGVVAASETNAVARPKGVGLSAPGATAAEFRGRITQSGGSGQAFTSYGFLTRLAGATDADLFDGSRQDVTTALMTMVATGDLVSRVLDVSVHALDIVGELTVYQRSGPGASFDDPSSFSAGHAVATFAMTLQDILAVFAPAQGIPTLTGDMVQTRAGRLSGGVAGHRFGKEKSRFRFFATGLGRLTDPVTLNAQLEMAGNWATE